MSYCFMCGDPERAALNRKIISKKLYIEAYLQVEAWLADNPVKDLPSWMYYEGFVGERAKVRAARKGGFARAKKLSPKRRSEIAKKASHSRKIYLARPYNVFVEV